jgi:UDPglucose 6-dehydrogenase
MLQRRQEEGKMNILIVGTGYVGLATGIALAKKGHKVKFYDKDKEKIELLKKGKLFFFEPLLQEALKEFTKNQNVFFFDNLKEALENIEIVFVCVGTPILKDGRTNSKDIEKAIKEIKKYATKDLVVAIKSTINPKVYTSIKNILASSKFHLSVNPEFLREGSALNDSLNPSRIVIGTENEYAKKILDKLYAPFEAPKIFTDPMSAILTKYASNAFLAIKISFINEIANLSDRIGANIDDIALGTGLDPRIGKDYLKAGIGFGGSCLPKDTKNMVKYAKEIGIRLDLINSVNKINERQYKVVIEKLQKHLVSLKSRTIAIFGLSFKGDTDDLRNSISLKIIKDLEKEGAILRLHDYLAFKKAKKIINNAFISDIPYFVAEGSEAIVIATDWKEYSHLDWEKIRKLMKGNLIIDGRNILDKDLLKKIGFVYEGIGRK